MPFMIYEGNRPSTLKTFVMQSCRNLLSYHEMHSEASVRVKKSDSSMPKLQHIYPLRINLLRPLDTYML